ncbi:hypothetical protein Taro_052969 [Colocasia esculenta]|uniref:Uncharacterized protein n=1 Tax=Colocasia esculenta TaxID=4460 RepID=A0A843XKU1_COLES|nr:hypothetical protein [Colocasia esculenta]
MLGNIIRAQSGPWEEHLKGYNSRGSNDPASMTMTTLTRLGLTRMLLRSDPIICLGIIVERRHRGAGLLFVFTRVQLASSYLWWNVT